MISGVVGLIPATLAPRRRAREIGSALRHDRRGNPGRGHPSTVPDSALHPSSDPVMRSPPLSSNRISARIGAISESATLAVDAKAKALRAAGEDVIGFGAGEPDFPTPQHIVDAAVAACQDTANHRYSPAGWASCAARSRRRQDRPRQRLPGRAVAGAHHQRRQARAVQHLRHPPGPGRRGAAARAVLDHLSRVDPAGRRCHRPGRHPHGERIPRLDRAARGGGHRPHQGAGLRLAQQPDRCRLPARRGEGHRSVGRRARASG